MCDQTVLKWSYLQQPGEPLFLPHFSHFSASALQQFSVPFSSPQPSQIVASASFPHPDKKARQMDVRETISSCFMVGQTRENSWRVKGATCEEVEKSDDGGSGLGGRGPG